MFLQKIEDLRLVPDDDLRLVHAALTEAAAGGGPLAEDWTRALTHVRAELDRRAPCPRCGGCGQIANTDDGEPWTAWTSLPVRSAAAVVLGVVRPIPCPTCSPSTNGTA